MTAIGPRLAADLANGVYGIRTIDNISDAFISRGVGGLEQQFDTSRTAIVSGRSGGRVVNQSSGFGLVMPFTNGRQGEWTVAIRGTVTAYDWITNLNAAASPGPTGQPVHAGFRRAYDQLIDGVVSSFQGANPSKVHVVGHSLGGAIANMVASKLHDIGLADISLYTFGAPRAGFAGYAEQLTRSLSPQNIHRVYNISDVVPMIPLFPFTHAPSDADGYRVSTTGKILSLNAHYMSSYGPAVGSAEWPSLARQGAGVQSALSVDYWLDVAKDNVSFPGSSLAFYAIGKALSGLLGMIKTTLGISLLGAVSVLDQLAAILYRAAMLSSAILGRLLDLMQTALRFTGRAVSTAGEVTVAFISWVLRLMMSPVIAIGSAAARTFDR